VGTISASGTFPTTAEFTEWVVWADGKMKSYLQCGSTLPTDIGDILKDVADDLLIRKYRFEKEVGFATSRDMLDESGPQLTPENKTDLDSLKGQDTSSDDPPAFNFDLDVLEGGFDD
jgi:hypothetical protein